jgi:hypothetical protein
MNAFIIQAVAEKVAALRARGLLRDLTASEQLAYLESRASRSQPGRFSELLMKAGTATEVLPGNEIPEGWLKEMGAQDAVADPGTAENASSRRE